MTNASDSRFKLKAINAYNWLVRHHLIVSVIIGLAMTTSMIIGLVQGPYPFTKSNLVLGLVQYFILPGAAGTVVLFARNKTVLQRAFGALVFCTFVPAGIVAIIIGLNL
jgi:hypothetical protein